MVQEQAQILAKKNGLPRGASDLAARIDREANNRVSVNVRKLVDAGDYSQVTALLQQSTSLSLGPISTALRSLMRAHRSDEVNELMRLVRSKNVLPPEAIFNEVVCYFANGARTAKHASSSSSNSSNASSLKKASVEADRATFFFADLKTAYVPSTHTYDRMWFMVPMTRQKNRTWSLTDHHDNLWHEMAAAGVPPSERVCVAMLRSLRPDSAPTATIAKLEDIENTFRSAFGVDPQATSASVSSLSQDILGSRHSKHKMSGILAKLWLSKVLALQGEEKAFRLASSVLQEIAEDGSLPRASSSAFHASNATYALALSYDAKLAAKLATNLHAPRVIPTEFCPFEPLIEVLSAAGKSYAAIEAWNRMSSSAKLAAAPSTIFVVTSVLPLSVQKSLLASLPDHTKADSNLLLPLLALDTADGGRPHQLSSYLVDFISTLPNELGVNLVKQNFFEESFKIIGRTSKLGKTLDNSFKKWGGQTSTASSSSSTSPIVRTNTSSKAGNMNNSPEVPQAAFSQL